MLSKIMIALCTVFRIIPHPPNLAPVGATAVFAGRTLSMRKAILVTFIAMFIGDFFLAQIHGYSMLSLVTPFVYAGFAAQAFLGRTLRLKNGGLLGAAIGGALFFFFISNLGVWLTSGMYAKNLIGLGQCYAAAIPFLGGTLVGDIAWVFILNGVYRLLQRVDLPLKGQVPVSTEKLPLY